MRACAQCEFFKRFSKEGGNCRLEPPKIFLVPVEGPAKLNPLSKKLEPGPVTMAAQSYFPAVRNDDFCSRFTLEPAPGSKH